MLSAKLLSADAPGVPSPGGGKGIGTPSAGRPRRFPERMRTDALLALLGGVVDLLRGFCSASVMMAAMATASAEGSLDSEKVADEGGVNPVAIVDHEDLSHRAKVLGRRFFFEAQSHRA